MELGGGFGTVLQLLQWVQQAGLANISEETALQMENGHLPGTRGCRTGRRLWHGLAAPAVGPAGRVCDSQCMTHTCVTRVSASTPTEYARIFQVSGAVRAPCCHTGAAGHLGYGGCKGLQSPTGHRRIAPPGCRQPVVAGMPVVLLTAHSCLPGTTAALSQESPHMRLEHLCRWCCSIEWDSAMIPRDV